MPERTSYEPGTPSWVDLSTPDVDGAKRFYTELFGWDAEDAGPPEETGGYGFFTQGGKRIAGVGPIMSEGQPTVWMTYVASADAETTVQKARDAGATIHVEPMDVMDAGRMAMLRHPGAGALGVWQARRPPGRGGGGRGRRAARGRKGRRAGKGAGQPRMERAALARRGRCEGGPAGRVRD